MTMNDESLRPLERLLKQTFHVMLKLQKGGEREKEVENLLKEIMAKNFPNLRKDLDIQFHDVNMSAQNDLLHSTL